MKTSFQLLALGSALHGPYSMETMPRSPGTNQARQREKNHFASVVGCAVCGKTNKTLLKREGKRVCKECYQMILRIRTEAHDG